MAETTERTGGEDMTGDRYHHETAPSRQNIKGSRLFPCPKCDGPTFVRDVRNANNGTGERLSCRVRRRRACTVCGWHFTTVEVQKKESDREYNAAMLQVINTLIARLEQMQP